MEHLGQLIDVNIFVFPLIFQLFINCWLVSIVLSAEVGLEIDGTFLFSCFVLIFLFSGSIWAFTRSSYFQSSKRKMGYLGSYAYIRGRHVASCYEYYSNKRENQWIKNKMFWRLRQWVKVIYVCQFQTFTTCLWLPVTWSQANKQNLYNIRRPVVTINCTGIRVIHFFSPFQILVLFSMKVTTFCCLNLQNS